MEGLKDFLKPEIIWFLIGIGLLIMEFALPGLIIAFFALGAIIVGVVCLFADISVNAQLLIFIISSVLSLVLLRQWVKGVFFGHVSSEQDLKKDLSDFVGKKVVVIKRITPEMGGKVEFNGTNWRAEAEEVIEEEQVVEIVGKDNLTLKVKSLEKETEDAS